MDMIISSIERALNTAKILRGQKEPQIISNDDSHFTISERSLGW